VNGPDYSLARQPRSRRRFCVLLPVLRPPDMLPYAIRSVLAQTETDFELCVICDGAPPETAEVAKAIAAGDPRVLVFPFPKGARHGEVHRAAVLDGARADFVAHIGDDDLWLPDHLVILARLLARADFVNVPGFYIRPDRRLRALPLADLADANARRRMLETRWNFFGPTECGYRLSAYRSLPEGWAPGPEELQSDLNMWRKFLRQPGMRLRSGQELSTLKFPTPDWGSLSLEEREAANRTVWDLMQDPARLASIRRLGRQNLAGTVRLEAYAPLLRRDPLTFGPLCLLALAGRRRNPPLF
jgi:glycosyltransferase involved in cell wall biosynthesis